MSTFAQQLTGKQLEKGWCVVTRVERPATATGGWFSAGYIVESQEHGRAYLKALDFSAALASDDPALVLNAMTDAFNYERHLCELCRDRRLSRVVRAIDDGKIFVDPANPASVVQYLVFELAEGDVRTQLDAINRFDAAWALRSLHHIATGLKQLHGVDVAHQDLKPSNVLMFQDGSKVADLGRATSRGLAGPNDDLAVPGDMSYAPPELLYRWQDGDWNRRCFGCDAYLMGSMVVFFFIRLSMTALLLTELSADHHWRKWNGTFAEILPYLQDAFGRSVRKFASALQPEFRDDLVAIVRELCNPDPKHRGCKKDAGGNQYSLHRHISRFNLLARKAELGLWR